MENVSKENPSSTIERDVFLTPHAKPTIETMEEEEEEHSDDEMFYSPSADNVNVDQQPFEFAQPISLFPEISDTIQTQQPLEEEEDKQIDFIETDYSLKENSNESNKHISFAFNEPSNYSMDGISMFNSETPASVETLHAESPATLEKSLKPSRRTFIFSKSNPDETVEPETEPQEVDTVAEGVEERPMQEVDFTFKTPMAVDKSSRKSRTFVFGKQFTANQTRSSESRLQDENVQQSEAIERSFAFKTPKETLNPSMTFTVPKKAPAEEVESVLQELNNSESQLKNDSQTQMSIQESLEKTRRVSKYNFTFSKPGSSETETRQDEKRTLPDSNVPVSDISSFSFQSELKSRSSRRTFVFSKKVPLSESSSADTDSLLQSSESQSKNQSEFTKAAAETYEEFSIPLKKS